MKTTHVKKFSGTPFIIECCAVENRPGTWNTTKVSIFRDDNLIGEYLRNYSGHGPDTFYPFLIGDEWYALYSANYTATRVMKLHNDRIEDWCGEENDANGFCPVEFYIPRYKQSTHTMDIQGESHNYSRYYVDNDYKDENEFLTEEVSSLTPVTIQYTDFGFLSGCIWGDDNSWKLRYIDLSKIPERELIITDKFGYWELPNKSSLKECINMANWQPDHTWVELTKMENVNLKTGERY
jgi:hypothetical protein